MDYTTLQADVATYLHRTDLAAQIPKFIEKARLRIGRDLRSLEQEVTTTLTSPVDSVFTLPAGFLELRRCQSAGIPLRSVNPHELAYWLTLSSPQVYVLRGRNLTAPGATTVDIWYFGQESVLSSGATEHPTMAAHPQVWTAASVFEGFLYLQDPDNARLWAESYESEVAAVNSRAELARQGQAPMVINSDQFSTFGESRN